VWTKNFLEFFLVYFVVSLLTGTLTLLGALLVLGIPLTSTGFGGFSFTAPPSQVNLAAFVVYLVAALIVSLVIGSIVTGGMTDFAVRRRRGEAVRLSDSLWRGVHRFPSILGANLLVTLIIFALVFLPFVLLLAGVLAGIASPLNAIALFCGALILLPVVGFFAIYLWVSLSLYAPAIMVEGATALDSLGRSWHLTKGHRWSIFGAALVIGLLAAVVSIAISTPLAFLHNPAVSVLASALVAGIYGSWFVILAAVAYELIVREPRFFPYPPPSPVPQARWP